MILIDSSVWIRFFRSGDAECERLLLHGDALIHEIVIGELACGNLKNRAETLHNLSRIPRIPPAPVSEAFRLLESAKLFGQGVGWNDVQLLAAAGLCRVPIYTHDLKLARAAQKVGVNR